MTDTAAGRSITKSVTIDWLASQVHSYPFRRAELAAVIHHVLAVQPGSDPQLWQMTPRSLGQLRIRVDAATGLLDPAGARYCDDHV